MKIAILHPSLDVMGGAEKQVLNLANQLQQKGHEVIVYVSKLDESCCYPELIKKVKVVECGGFGYKHYRLGIITSLYYMFKMSRRVKDCDIINCHNYPSIYAAVKVKKRLRKPIVWMCNEPPFPPLFKEKKGMSDFLYRIVVIPFLLFNKLAVKHIDEIVVLDELNSKRIQKAYGITPKIIHTGLDFPKTVNRYKKDGSFRLLSVGRVDKGKRVEDTLHAIKLLKDKIPEIKLDVAGSGKELETMIKLSSDLGTEEYVTFHGRVSDEKLSELYDKCDVFIFTAENQSWGLVPLEAMTHKKPCLVSTGSGVADILSDKVNCIKIRPKEVNEIVKNTTRLYRDKKFRDQIAKNGLDFVHSRFSWEKYAKNMEKIIVARVKQIIY